jgi:hypothetical protein
MRGGGACLDALSWQLLAGLLMVLLAAPAGCGFDSQPVRARTAGGAGTDNGGQSQAGTSATGGAGGRSGSGGRNDRDASPLDAGPATDAGRDSGPPDSGPNDGGGDPPISCIPNRIRTCYSGPEGTRMVGECKPGTHRCKADGSGYGPCTGEVLPSPDVCSNELDDDCDGVVNDGFPEVAGCECEPGSSKECYTGPAAFKGVGNCTLGAITCNPLGTAWSACSGDVLPTAPRCGVTDRDCNGISDDQQDLDGDGFSLCDGDCCDRTADGCSTPALVNPGAYDIAGNAIDDDCTGTPDDALLACDGTLTAATADAFDYAKALDLCQRTTASLPRSALRWGVLNATLTLSDGSGTPRPAQRMLRPAFGAIVARRGARMVALSTGHAAAPGETDPAFEPFEPGKELGTTSAMPSDWLDANGGVVPQVAGCPAEIVAPISVFDSVMLTLTVRVPTNMRSFALRAYLLSAEFPEYVCDERTDYALALLSSTVGAPTNPSDANLATFTTAGGVRYPLGPTLAFGDTGAFRQCQNGTLSCQAEGVGTSEITTCEGTSDLAGTGFEQAAQAGMPPCDANSQIGGGTDWLTIRGNVAPGETIVLRLVIWDTGDDKQDSLVLFDDFQWSSTAVEAGIGL